jgi:hypothetical protein
MTNSIKTTMLPLVQLLCNKLLHYPITKESSCIFGIPVAQKDLELWLVFIIEMHKLH